MDELAGTLPPCGNDEEVRRTIKKKRVIPQSGNVPLVQSLMPAERPMPPEHLWHPDPDGRDAARPRPSAFHPGMESAGLPKPWRGEAGLLTVQVIGEIALTGEHLPKGLTIPADTLKQLVAHHVREQAERRAAMGAWGSSLHRPVSA